MHANGILADFVSLLFCWQTVQQLSSYTVHAPGYSTASIRDGLPSEAIDSLWPFNLY